MITARLLLMPVLRSVELNVVDCAQRREGVEGEDGGGHEERRQPRTDFRMDVFDDLHTRCFIFYLLAQRLRSLHYARTLPEVKTAMACVAHILKKDSC